MNAASMALVPSSPRAVAYSAATGERAHAPGRDLVAADVQPRRVEHRGERTEHGLDERHRGRQSRDTASCRRSAARCCAPVASSGSRSDGTAVERRVAVAGKIDLGHDHDAELAARARPIRGSRRPCSSHRSAAAGEPSNGGIGKPVATPGADGGQVGVAVDRHPPRLVVGEVEVEPIELAPRRQIDDPLDVGRREELAGEIDVQPAPLVRRPVDDPHRFGDRRGAAGRP